MTIKGQLRDNFAYFSIKTCCGYSLESRCGGNSNEYPQYVFMRTDESYP